MPEVDDRVTREELQQDRYRDQNQAQGCAKADTCRHMQEGDWKTGQGEDGQQDESDHTVQPRRLRVQGLNVDLMVREGQGGADPHGDRDGFPWNFTGDGFFRSDHGLQTEVTGFGSNPAGIAATIDDRCRPTRGLAHREFSEGSKGAIPDFQRPPSRANSGASFGTPQRLPVPPPPRFDDRFAFDLIVFKTTSLLLP